MMQIQARRRVSIFGGAGVKKIIIFIPMRVPSPSAPAEKKNGPCLNKRIFVIVHASSYPVSTFQKKTGTPTRF